MATQIERNTAKLMLKKLRAKLDGLFQQQELEKQASGQAQPEMTPTMKYGGMIPKAEFGLKPGLGQNLGGTSGYTMAQDEFAKAGTFNPTDNAYYGNVNVLGSPESARQFADTASTGGPLNTYGSGAATPPQVDGGGGGWNTALNVGLGIASAAPIAYNLIQGSRKEQQLNPKDFYNPYENDVRSIMRNRRFNVNPLMERNKNSQAIFNANVKKYSSSRGEILNNLGVGYTGRMRMDAEALTQKQNMDLGYMGEQAQMDAALGQQRANTKLGVQNMNDQNEAARRNYLASAAGQLSNLTQAQQLMMGQRQMDKKKLDIIRAYSPYAKNYFPGFLG